MTPGQQRAMKRGRDRAAKARRKAAIERVAQYRRWLERGCRGPLPLGVPSDHDYRLTRERNR